MTILDPWAFGPFELLVHAEEHLLRGDDFDRRIALISFDNAIEVAIATYLTLNPIQRNGRNYPKVEVERWLTDYHTKLNFLEAELSNRGLPWAVDKSHIVFCHQHRNEQYHGGHKGTPEKSVLEIARQSALWIFSLLFDAPDIENLLNKAIIDQAPPEPPQREKSFDKAIDHAYGIINVGEQNYYTSETLFAVDLAAYTDLGTRLCGETPTDEDTIEEIE